MAAWDKWDARYKRTEEPRTKLLKTTSLPTPQKWKIFLESLKNWRNGSPIFKQPILVARMIKGLLSSSSLYAWLFFFLFSNGVNQYFEHKIFLLISRLKSRTPISPVQITSTTS